jgi:formyl-CoA transferase
MGSAHRMFAPYQAVRCADGYITLGSASTRTWELLARAIEREDLLERPEYAHATDRVRNRARLASEIESVTTMRPRAHWLARFEREGVPCGPILDYEHVFADPHVRARGVAVELDHPVAGRIRVVGPAVKLSETPARVARPSPLYGQHTAEVLAELGYTPDEIGALAADGVVALAPGPPQGVSVPRLLFERDGPLALVTFNRPEARNAITWAMYDGLQRPATSWTPS